MLSWLSTPSGLLITGSIFILLYSIGHFGRFRFSDTLKTLGFSGGALIVLKIFWSYCAMTAVSLILPLLFLGIVIHAICWVVGRVYSRHTHRPGISIVEQSDSPGPTPH